MSEMYCRSEGINITSSYALDAVILLKSMKVVYIFTDKSGNKHLPFNLKHCTAASCNFLTLHFADTIYKPGLCLF